MEKGGLLPISRFPLRQRFQVPCRDTRCSVATRVGLRQDIFVAIGHGMSEQFRVHDRVPNARDQAALGTYTTKGRTTYELCHYREFFIVTDFLQFSLCQERLPTIFCRDRLLKVFYRDRESQNMGFSHVVT